MTKVAQFAETPWQKDVMKALGSRPDIMLYRDMGGTFCPVYKPKTFVEVGPVGIGDIMGVQVRRFDRQNCVITETVNPNGFNPMERQIQFFYGQAFAIETKSRTGNQEETQRDFQDAFTAMMGRYIVAPAPEWDIIWEEFGQEPDELCAAEGERLWSEIKRRRQEDEANRPVRRAKRAARR
jgi:hypothetical protein